MEVEQQGIQKRALGSMNHRGVPRTPAAQIRYSKQMPFHKKTFPILPCYYTIVPPAFKAGNQLKFFMEEELSSSPDRKRAP